MSSEELSDAAENVLREELGDAEEEAEDTSLGLGL